ncbi:permease-like cell division protein FtsX [Clostridium cellulovorans]|uniref:Cell division protein FtsX n=1 Tax=Clostridium cellulovorans (strain ATCC 35296 / DSM 3052 / OCM 3 / 743B) TaxID=573061 RepID=D9SUX2_CLOC7|nr:permease-like cell division protein FtsX [Clostridium cellulovorans]ADL51027.1 protein of unknown function DUF214 [Clostridium cellulovorans 743B]
MKNNSIKLFCNDALRSLRRNRTLTIASILTVALTLVILGCFMVISRTVDKAFVGLQGKLDIQVYLKTDITEAQQSSIKSKIEDIEGIKEITYISKDEAYKKMEEMMGNSKDMLIGLEDADVFPASFSVNVGSTEQLNELKDAVADMDGVESIKEGDDTVGKFESFKKVTMWILLGLSVVLFAVSLFLIANTIKLTVFSRRREIAIMKNIGATDWFIRWPFLIEGMILGFLGDIISVIILFAGYSVLYNKVSSAVLAGALIEPTYILTNILPIFTLFGIALGAVASIISMRKFLHV